MNRFRSLVCSLIVVAAFGLNGNGTGATEPCRIEVMEKGTGWPVPLVELRTTHLMRFISDNAGAIALDAPELMGREIWFDVIGHGYEVPKDGFGYRGVRLKPEPGKTLRVEVDRAIIARRLGRITGGGLFAESRKLGDNRFDAAETGVMGCDTIQSALHRGRLYWFWGDTGFANYPLGIFDCSGATTSLNPLANFEPPVQLSFDFFVDTNRRPRGVAPMPGDGPTWISGCVSVPDSNGVSRLVTVFSKIRGFLEPYQKGLCVWNDESNKFELLRVIWEKSASSPKPPLCPEGHPVFWKDERGKEWLLFGDPFPALRCPATFEAWQDPSQWETLQPQKNLVSASDHQPVVPHSGSIAWNAWRKRWVTVFVQFGGKPSHLGEVWYAEADSPMGPWGRAIKVLSHDNYTFYNPCLHPELTPTNSPVLLFEGTYSQTFADRPQPTPRYDYNQMLYRLDLDDPRLRPAQDR